MKHLFLTVLTLMLLAVAARAQETPVVEVAAGFSAIQVVKGFATSAYGGSGSAAYNFNDWLGAVGDFGIYHASSAPFGSVVSAGTYTFGPRVSYRHWGRVTPFGEFLLGGVRYANNGFVFGAGGGADIALDSSERFALRPQVEYFGFYANSSTVHTVRYCAELVFRFRKK
jgi:hypothetical protein